MSTLFGLPVRHRNQYRIHLFTLIVAVTYVISYDAKRNVTRDVCKPSYRSSPLDTFLSSLECLNAQFGRPLVCKCDKVCKYYGDCCYSCSAKDFLNQTDLKTKAECDYGSGILSVRKCPLDFNDGSLRDLCESSEEKTQQSVLGTNTGIVFGNRHYAWCNGEIDTVPIYTTNSSGYLVRNRSVRPCSLQPVFNCSYSNLTIWNHNLNDLCDTYLSPVISQVAPHLGVAFKNIFCAICNGVPLESVTIPSVYVHMSKMKMMQMSPTTARSRDVPAAFSILLNFGLDGKERMMYSSENEENMRMYQAKCGFEKIYDPFSGLCRKLFCSSQFTLVNFKCVRNTSSIKNDTENSYSPSYDVKSKYAELTLSMQSSLRQLSQYAKTKSADELQVGIRDSIAELYKITPSRIKNLTVELDDDTMMFIALQTPDFFQDFSVNKSYTLAVLEVVLIWNKMITEKLNFSVKFLLYEQDFGTKLEPSVDKIVSQMVTTISISMFTLSVDCFSSRVFAIKQNISVLDNWCGLFPREIRLTYWNEEFELIQDKNAFLETGITSVYINKTGRFYEKGEFVANILYQGYDDNDSNNVNISGCVIVCHEARLNDSCERIEIERGQYHILPDFSVKLNGSIKIGKNVDLTNYEYGDNGSILICYDKNVELAQGNDKNTIILPFDSAQAMVSTIFMCISVIALSCVLFTYLIFGELRNLPGCNTMNLTVTLLLSQAMFLLGQRAVVVGWMCKATAIFLHYVLLASFFWMNIMAFDLYQTFGKHNVLTFIRSKRKLLPKYILYAYGTPALIIIISVIQETYDNSFMPNYGSNFCWIGNAKVWLFFFAVPLVVIILLNFVFYIKTILSISSVQRKIETKCKTSNGRKDVLLYTRMATVMGFTWVFGFLIVFISMEFYVLVSIFTYLFIIFNTLQGVFIFFAFVCNKRVIKLYKGLVQRLQNLKLATCPNCRKALCSCSMKNFAKKTVRKTSSGVSRSISTDTTISVVSNG